MEALTEYGFTVDAIVAIVDREEPDTKRPSGSLFTLKEITG